MVLLAGTNYLQPISNFPILTLEPILFQFFHAAIPDTQEPDENVEAVRVSLLVSIADTAHD